MGWFDSIKNAVGSAGNWVASNSGSILGVAKTIAQVAGAIAVTEEERELLDDEVLLRDDVADLQINYNKADRYLAQLAESKTPMSALEAASDGVSIVRGGTVRTQTATLSGIWTQPADLDQNGNPLVDVVQDISRFLHQHNIPTTIKMEGAVLDTAQLIGRAAFQGTSSAADLHDRSDLVKTSVFSIEGDEECAITGCMAYYAIPMGQAQDSSQDITALHSALYVRSTTTQQFRRAQAMERRSMCVGIDPSQYTINSCGWLVTAQVSWSSILLAQQAWPQMKRILATDKLQVVFNQQQGNLEVIKILAASGIPPHQVKTELVAAIASALKSLTFPPIYVNMHTAGLGSATWTQLPIVEITNSTLSCGGNSSTTNSDRKSKASGNAHSDCPRASTESQSVTRDTTLATRNRYRHDRGPSKGDEWVEVE